MSFCPSCGTQIKENENFCPKCGTEAPSNEVLTPEVVINQCQGLRFRNVRDEAEYVRDYFLRKKNVYDSYIKTYSEENSMKVPKKKSAYLPIYWLFCSAYLIFAGFMYRELTFAIIGIISVPLLILLFIALKKRYNKKCDAFDKKTDEIQKRREAYERDLCEYYDAYEDCPVAAEYTFPEDIKAITDYITSRRADSFKEAVNLYEAQQDIDEMKDNISQMAYNAQMANVKAGLAATFAAASYLKK